MAELGRGSHGEILSGLTSFLEEMNHMITLAQHFKNSLENYRKEIQGKCEDENIRENPLKRPETSSLSKGANKANAVYPEQTAPQSRRPSFKGQQTSPKTEASSKKFKTPLPPVGDEDSTSKKYDISKNLALTHTESDVGSYESTAPLMSVEESSESKNGENSDGTPTKSMSLAGVVRRSSSRNHMIHKPFTSAGSAKDYIPVTTPQSPFTKPQLQPSMTMRKQLNDWQRQKSKPREVDHKKSIFDSINFVQRIQARAAAPANKLTAFMHNKESLEEEMRELANRQLSNKKPKYVVSHQSFYLRCFEMLVMTGGLYTAYYTPLFMGILRFQPKANAVRTFLGVILILYDFVFIFDVFLKSRKTYINSAHEEITNKAKILRHYIRSKDLPLDLLAAIPYGLLMNSLRGDELDTTISSASLMRLMKLFMCGYFGRFKNYVLKSFPSASSAVLRLLGILLTFWTLIHLYACMYLYNLHVGNFIGSWNDLRDSFLLKTKDYSVWAYYVQGIYVSLLIICGNAHSTAPTAASETIFSCIGLLMSFFVNAVIVGSATTVLTNLDTAAIAHKKQIDAMNEFLTVRRVPSKIQHKIISYYEFLWLTGQSSHAEQLFVELPDKLKMELSMSLNKKLIEQVPLFESLPPDGVCLLVQKLEPMIVLPQDLIIREGDTSSAMYFIKRGVVRCYTVHPETQEEMFLITLHEGCSFGEVAMSNPASKRTANIQAIGFCELRCLHYADFQVVLQAFPDFKKAVEKAARRSVTQNMIRRSQREEETESEENAAHKTRD